YKQLHELKEAINSAQRDGEELLSQLFQLQSELEAHYVGEKASSSERRQLEESLAEAKSLMHQTEVTLSEKIRECEIARKNESKANTARKVLVSDQERLTKQLNELSAELTVTQGEKSLLISQLHSVQNELES